MLYKSGQIFLPFCHNSRVWRTDGRTNGRTEFSSLDRVCIPCSAVKMTIHCSFVANTIGWDPLLNILAVDVLSWVAPKWLKISKFISHRTVNGCFESRGAKFCNHGYVRVHHKRVLERYTPLLTVKIGPKSAASWQWCNVGGELQYYYWHIGSRILACHWYRHW